MTLVEPGDDMPSDELVKRVVEASRHLGSDIWEEVAHERARAHIKHGDTSMESLPVTDLTRLTVLMEEVGEVARVFNEWRHTGTFARFDLRQELIQVAAMAGAWADVLDRCSSCRLRYDEPPCSRNPETGRGFHTVFGGVGVTQGASDV